MVHSEHSKANDKQGVRLSQTGISSQNAMVSSVGG